MKIDESYGKHPYNGSAAFIFTMKVSGKASSYYRPVPMTDKQKREAKKEFRAYLDSGMSAAQWHDSRCKKCKGA
ncbi:hypothetical protein PP425_gp008 [Enterobacter phage vB_EclM_Q7622]|uniref:hypothetical protein n=1 Tax=Enterobacter phage vB_EclM_Q7622 TaxID=2908628 RepID=UPI00232938C5|nr:hypothetical protein PP425_gp008 [Enterobacter phage vB_EclM_Q7622]UIS65523.1 hypothetical protein Q76222_00008 [Enterobacter phage vB_EclM_Q7622]